MPKTSISLSEHFDGFIASQIEAGRYDTASEVVRAALRLLEEHETAYQQRKLDALRAHLDEGIVQLDKGQGVSITVNEAIQEHRKTTDG